MVDRLLEVKAMQSLFSHDQPCKKIILLMLLIHLNKKYLLVDKLRRHYIIYNLDLYLMGF